MSRQFDALLISIVMEVPLAMGLAMGLAWVERAAWSRLFLVAISTTLLTHPFAWWGYRGLRTDLTWEHWPAFILVEVLVSLIEAVMYWRLARLTLSNAVTVAVLVNAASALFGGHLAGVLGLR